MRANILSRIDRLERTAAQKRVPPGLNPVSKLAMYAAAVLFGGLQPHEAIMEGYARALGYSNAAEVRAAIRASKPEFTARHEAALARLCDQFGFDPVSGTDEEIMDFADKLMRAIPQDLLRRLRV